MRSTTPWNRISWIVFFSRVCTYCERLIASFFILGRRCSRPANPVHVNDMAISFYSSRILRYSSLYILYVCVYVHFYTMIAQLDRVNAFAFVELLTYHALYLCKIVARASTKQDEWNAFLSSLIAQETFLKKKNYSSLFHSRFRSRGKDGTEQRGSRWWKERRKDGKGRMAAKNRGPVAISQTYEAALYPVYIFARCFHIYSDANEGVESRGSTRSL